MISIDFETGTYICPFCHHAQAYLNSYDKIYNGDYKNYMGAIPKEYQESSLSIYTLKCNNSNCRKISVIAKNRTSGKQIDVIPQTVINYFPDYVPDQIRSDYEEASLIIEESPKAAATLLRRCLQGMIRDFWGIQKKNLYDEISELESKIPRSQWKALDGLRKIGNIGAHMEKDVNLIIDIHPDEAKKLLKLIELLIEKWYVARHEEEELYEDITGISEEKDAIKSK